MHSTMVNAIEVSHLRRTFTSHIGVIRRTSKEIVHQHLRARLAAWVPGFDHSERDVRQ
jgi:hypothetical protein